MITLGKNKITNILNNKKKILGSNNYYNYYYYRFDKKIDINFKSENIFIYILECKNQKQTLRVKNNLINLRENDLIKVKKKKIDTISIYATDSITLLIVYSSKTSKKEKKITIQKIKNFYTVNKPWGYEQWLTGANNKNFAFKKIFLKKGTKTSLQYHVKKIETNFLFDGRAKLHFMIKNIYLLKKNFKKILISVKCKKISKGSVINVRPKTIHRLEAISNLTLFEVSSPHLSDVIRISDDSNRPDGKIKHEHK